MQRETEHWLPKRWVVILTLLCVGSEAWGQYAQRTLPSLQFTPATFNQQTDSMGFRWDVNQQGAIGDGTNDAFDGGLTLRIGGTQFQSSQPLMAAANNEYVLRGKIGSVNITRRVKIDQKRAFARYVESFTNPGPATRTVSFTIYSDLGTTPQLMITSTGRLAAGPLTKKEDTVVCFQQPNSSRPSIVMYFGNARSKVKPALSRSGDDISVNVSLTIRPGKTVSFLHAAAQRNFRATPTASEIKALVKPLGKQEFLKDLPSTIRRTIVNYGTVLFGGELGEESLLKPNMARALGVQPGASDILAIGETSRLRGTVSCESLKIETSFGEHEIEFDNAAALVGGKWSEGKGQVFLRDGQVLTGKLTARGMQFSTIVGSSTKLAVESLDRLVMRQSRKPIQPVGDMYVVTFNGDRVAVKFTKGTRLPLLTMWGVLNVRMSEIAWVVPTDDEVPGFQVRLRNGSRFFAYVRDVDLPFTSPVMGEREIAASELRGLVSAVIANSTEDDQSLNPRPRLLLRGGQVLVGRFVEDAIDIQAEGQPLLIPRDEIRAMKRREQDDQVLPNTAPQYVVLLWSGDLIACHLRDDMFAVQVDDQVCNVPLRDLMEVHIPVPKLTAEGRSKILELIGKLGEEDWRTRKLASRQLAEAGYLAVPLLRDASKTSNDPEVRRRSRSLVEQLDVPLFIDPQ